MKYIFGAKRHFDVDINDMVNLGLPDPKILWGRESRQWSRHVRPSGQNRRGVVIAECSSLLRWGCQMSLISYRICENFISSIFSHNTILSYQLLFSCHVGISTPGMISSFIILSFYRSYNDTPAREQRWRKSVTTINF
jgi:hypothetical protein